ncbi:uncharacterized protein LOC114581384 [Dendrobium catenatum]|uniref:uncharacterized protein LOC114581384 n=1 Tax=Dendrobium catenatum TaxID=906689 RepID=UPI00109F0FE2|nr:uncharacterized protein LOC114581384 [Dendrobium catenatum]
MVRGKDKTNTSSRRDPSWKYSVQVDVGSLQIYNLFYFGIGRDFFGLQAAKSTIVKWPPVELWIQFGDSTPELQSFAVRVLGLVLLLGVNETGVHIVKCKQREEIGFQYSE